MVFQADLQSYKEPDGEGDAFHSKRMLRQVLEISRKLDKLIKEQNSYRQIFDSENVALRQRLKNKCEQIIFKDPLGNGSKAEELLWRKGFYDVIQLLKQHKHKVERSTTLYNAVCSHLSSSLGFYQHLLLRICHDYELKLDGVCLDWYVVTGQPTVAGGGDYARVQSWATGVCHKTLIHLGDSARYQYEFGRPWDFGLARHYYLEAVELAPDSGMPYNQLATLAGSSNHYLTATYYYLRCLNCAEPFDGANGNLYKIFERVQRRFLEIDSQPEVYGNLKPEWSIRRLMIRFIHAVSLFQTPNPLAVDEVKRLCNILLGDFDQCLYYRKGPVRQWDNGNPCRLESDVVLLLVALALLCVQRHRVFQSQLEPVAKALASTMLSYLLSHSQKQIAKGVEEVIAGRAGGSVEGVSRTQGGLGDSVVRGGEGAGIGGPDGALQGAAGSRDAMLEEEELVGGRGRRRLRRRRQRLCSEEELASEEESTEELGGDSDSSLSSGYSQGEWEEEGEEQEDTDGRSQPTTVVTSLADPRKKPEEMERSRILSPNVTIETLTSDTPPSSPPDCFINSSLTPQQLLSVLLKVDMFMAVKVLCDWCRHDDSLIESLSFTLLCRLRNLLNALPTAAHCAEYLRDNGRDGWAEPETGLQTVPLPEDRELWNLPSLEASQASMLLDCRLLSDLEQTAVRCAVLHSFGRWVSELPGSRLEYDVGSARYQVAVAIGQSRNAEESKREEERRSLMRKMGELRLTSELSELQQRVVDEGPVLPLYLVPDTQALCRHLPTVRALANSNKFIVVITASVIDSLDLIKKADAQARDVIKYLETELRRGNRFIRHQHPDETALLPGRPVIPRRNVESTRLLSVVECCYYLLHENRSDTADPLGVPNVCLLTAEEHPLVNDTLLTAVNTANIPLYSVPMFYEQAKSLFN